MIFFRISIMFLRKLSDQIRAFLYILQAVGVDAYRHLFLFWFLTDTTDSGVFAVSGVW